MASALFYYTAAGLRKTMARVDAEVAAVDLATATVRRCLADAEVAVSSEHEADAQRDLRAAVAAGLPHVRAAHDVVMALRRAAETAQAHPGGEVSAAVTANHARAASTRVTASVRAFATAKAAARDGTVSRLARRVAIASGGAVTEAAARAAVAADPEHAGTLVAAFLQGEATEPSEEAVAALADAQSRAADVAALVRSLAEVAALFDDLRVLVAEQSDALSRIEDTVEVAVVTVRKGNANMRDAVAEARRARKCMFCVVITLIVIIIIVVFGMLGGTGKLAPA